MLLLWFYRTIANDICTVQLQKTLFSSISVGLYKKVSMFAVDMHMRNVFKALT